jgi:asparagine synthase (glutamine-hydrolysing)
MCGLSGIIDPKSGLTRDRLSDIAAAMSRTLAHRGPDAEGFLIDAGMGLAFAHRRLAIVDLTPTGAQPMSSADGRYTSIYNGEIYNFQDLREELRAAGRKFRGTSDTEVFLEGCSQWGPERAVGRLNGMFAIVLVDNRERGVLLARDHMGIKPLYYAATVERLWFASEMKAFQHCPGWRAEIDPDALAAFLRHGYVPGPGTIYRGVFKLPPAHLMRWKPGAVESPRAYWSLRGAAERGQAKARSGAFDMRAAEDALDALLRDAVRRQMVADVPLGAYLSGGVDSSTVVALMQAQSNRPVRSFTVGFSEESHDESAHAHAIARHLGTDHTEMTVTARDALDVVPSLPEMFDEPFADSSQIPTALLSALTRKHVTVTLTGDGGDEAFAGYRRYAWASALWRWLGPLPVGLRRGAAAGLHAVNGTPAHWLPQGLADKPRKLAEMLSCPTQTALYRRLLTHWTDPSALTPAGREPFTPVWDESLEQAMPDQVLRCQYVDAATYLPDDILVKLDRAAMAASLEGRVPLLDYRVVEHAWSLPREARMARGRGKILLRRVLARYVPEALFERPKMGFGVPVGEWLRGPLRDWAADLIDPGAMKADGLIAPGPVQAAWAEHQAGRRNWQYPLWTVLMFQAWKRRWMP